MGDPRKIRKKYRTPSHPWQKARIEEEKIIVKEYGIKNKKELWKMESKLKDYADRAKKLVSVRTSQADKEKTELLTKLMSRGLLRAEAGLDDVLGLNLRDILERRLQTMVYKKGLARSVNQARQFIVHGHIKVADKKINSPSYVVSVKEEGFISFSPRSSLNDPDHPERIIQSESEAKKKSQKKGEQKEEVVKEEASKKEKPAKKEKPKAEEKKKEEKESKGAEK